VICLGTGSFISVNVGNEPLASNNAAYPIACFKRDDKKIYILHSVGCSTGISVDWAKSIGTALFYILNQTPIHKNI